MKDRKDKVATSMTLDQEVIDMIDNLLATSDKYTYRNDVVEEAVRRLHMEGFSDGENLESVHALLSSEDILVLSVGMNKVKYAKVEDGQMVVKTKTF